MIKLARLAAASALACLPLASAAWADCTCRAPGMVAKHGQTICLKTPQGQRLARCDKVSNVASWTFLRAPCPLAARPSPDRSPANTAYWLALSD